MSLICVLFKILERLIYAQVKTTINSLLPWEQGLFWYRRSTIDQATLLAQEIEDIFSAKKKIEMISVQNLLVSFCCDLGKDALQHFPLLGGLGKQF